MKEYIYIVECEDDQSLINSKSCFKTKESAEKKFLEIVTELKLSEKIIIMEDSSAFFMAEITNRKYSADHDCVIISITKYRLED